MPYKTNKELPRSVRMRFTEHAQTTFRKAFNSAHKQYNSEAMAFKVAYSAIKRAKKK